MKNFINVGKTEEEQVTQIKKWIKENALSLVAGAVIGFGGIFGIDIYEDYQHKVNLEARSSYIQKNIDNIESHTAYSQQLQMLQAKSDIEEKNYANALEKLNISIDKENILASVKQLRISRILLQQGKFDEALIALDGSKLIGSSNHLKGDIYLAQGNKELAKEFYSLAMTTTKNTQIKSILDIKINNLK